MKLTDNQTREVKSIISKLITKDINEFIELKEDICDESTIGNLLDMPMGVSVMSLLADLDSNTPIGYYLDAKIHSIIYEWCCTKKLIKPTEDVPRHILEGLTDHIRLKKAHGGQAEPDQVNPTDSITIREFKSLLSA